VTAWLDDGDVRLYHGDNLDVLRAMPDRSVHMCATSPPFYGLRDYGTGLW
jgi:DNA modification methylase